MSVLIKIGKGKGHAFSATFGQLSAELSPHHKKKTLEQIAKQLVKQAKIKDGEIELYALDFRISQRSKDSEGK